MLTLCWYGMLDSVTVAAISIESKPNQTNRNLELIGDACSKAKQHGVQLALFPELSITGFIPNHPQGNHEVWLRSALEAAWEIAQSISGPIVGEMQKIAAQNGIYIAAGMLEDAGNLLHNAHILVGPDGLIGRWRKMHIPMFEMPFYNGGEAVSAVSTPLGRIGVNICFDAFFPESTRLLALDRAEIVLFPFAADPPPVTPEGWSDWASLSLRARCVENGVFGVACNYLGDVECAGVRQSFPGGGMVLDPRGSIAASWDHSAKMSVATLHAATLRSARAEPEYLFRFRRPEIYGRLMKSSS